MTPDIERVREQADQYWSYAKQASYEKHTDEVTLWSGHATNQILLGVLEELREIRKELGAKR